MKRTEKIEVRVSQEEKSTLTDLAKQEGESVSGLVRSLIDKYMALNAASTKRRLPKWQLAGLLVIAAIIGHGLTLIPIHLHDRGHSKTAQAPVYYVHGVVGNSAFGVTVYEDDTTPKTLTLLTDDKEEIAISLSLSKANEAYSSEQSLAFTICEPVKNKTDCVTTLSQSLSVSKVWPSVLGNQTQSGLPVHLFVQEMA